LKYGSDDDGSDNENSPADMLKLAMMMKAMGLHNDD
jgi:hypothetical protein